MFRSFRYRQRLIRVIPVSCVCRNIPRLTDNRSRPALVGSLVRWLVVDIAVVLFPFFLSLFLLADNDVHRKQDYKNIPWHVPLGRGSCRGGSGAQVPCSSS